MCPDTINININLNPGEAIRQMAEGAAVVSAGGRADVAPPPDEVETGLVQGAMEEMPPGPEETRADTTAQQVAPPPDEWLGEQAISGISEPAAPGPMAMNTEGTTVRDDEPPGPDPSAIGMDMPPGDERGGLPGPESPDAPAVDDTEGDIAPGTSTAGESSTSPPPKTSPRPKKK
ncbi:hypothetical protein [Halomonas cerina]|uniref:Uncharacterized protein n=1 Tax=Halomonas cerina TaxID=447424 RepID=A0A839VAH7_9GAMM|nr:hypothetical protein [Halomonas cerina]MBB3192492.1 hypothetical protein [Halomonas cerina]